MSPTSRAETRLEASRRKGCEGVRNSISVLLLPLPLPLLLPPGGGGLAAEVPGGLLLGAGAGAGVTVVTFRLMRNLSENSPMRKPCECGGAAGGLL